MVKVNTVDLFGLSRGRQTPTQYDRRKKIADMLIDKGNEKPVSYNFAQGLSIVAPKIIGGILGKKADDEEEQEEKDANDTLMSALKGLDPDGSEASTGLNSGGSQSSSDDPAWSGSSEPRRSGGSGGASRSAAANERRQRAIARLTEKGYTPHAAEGIADNLFHESGFNTKAVGDNGTAFGLAQWRGPRFKNLKAFAASQGKDWQDFDTQVDFVDHEMKNRLDEGAGIAYAKLQRAQNADEAYNAFVQHYERPSAENLRKRLRQVRQRVASGEGFGGSIDEAPPAPQIDTREFDAQIQSGMLMMRNPRTRDAGFRLYQQGITGKAAARRESAKYGYETAKDAWKYRRERADKLEDRDFELERDDIKFRREQDAKTFQLSPGQRIVDRDGKVIAEGPPKTDSMVEVGPDGSIRVGTGGKLTETQSKDLLYHDRAVNAMANLDPVEDALTSTPGKLSEMLPEAVQGHVQPERYQLARQSALDFLAAILRKDSGAALTATDISTLGTVFLPQPGNPPAVLAQKRRSREVAIEALRKGLGPAAVLAAAAPDKFDGKSLVPKDMRKPSAPKPGDIVDGYRFKGGNPADEKAWEKVQ